MQVEVLWRGEGLLAASKESGIPVIPDRTGSCTDLKALLEEQTGTRLWVVHRIDRETSGLVLFATDAAAHRTACGLFESREVRKEYLALAEGADIPGDGVVDMPLRVFGSGRTAVDRGRGRDAVTSFEVIARGESFCLLSVRPLTGRRHQIRAHLFAIGHPVAGDPLYGDRGSRGRFGRLMLHAHALTLPWSGAAIRIVAPPPDRFVSACGAEFEQTLCRLE